MPKRKVRNLEAVLIFRAAYRLLIQCKPPGRHPSETLLNYNAACKRFLFAGNFCPLRGYYVNFSVWELLFSCAATVYKQAVFERELPLLPFREASLRLSMQLKHKQQPCFALRLFSNLRRATLSRTSGSRVAVRPPKRPEAAPENAPESRLRVFTAKANVGGGAALKLYIFCLCS